jgi:hypothetical protein
MRGISAPALLLSLLTGVALAGCAGSPVNLDPLSVNGRDGGGPVPSYAMLMRIGTAAQSGGRGALLGNRTNPEEARQLGQAAVRVKAEQFALAVMPIIAGILASGIRTDAGIAEALNARGVATARGGRWHAQTVKNVRARAARLAAEDGPCA